MILTDLRMPVMDGLEFAKAVKALPATAHIPIVLVRATPMTDSWAAPELFAALLLKPCSMAQLTATIDLHAQ